MEQTGQKNNTHGVRYSIVDSIVDNQGNEYNDIVFLDTDIFKGIKTRDWGKQLYSFVYNNLIGQQITVFDNMSESVIEFARKNDRVQKTGANNSRKVIDKLARKRDINSQLAVAHSVEVVSVSKYLPNQNSENTHQWLDENGWSFRTVYLMKRDGTILSALLNIAHAKDGRNILYDINKLTVIGHGDVPSNSNKSRGSHINTNNGKNTIPQPPEKSNTPDGRKAKDDTIDADYLSAVERGDTETAQQFSEVMDNARAEPEESGQKNNTHGVRYSIVDEITDDSGKTYKNVVLLDTNIFKGMKPRNWGTVLVKFVYNHLAGKQMVAYDENETETVIEFARTNERALKDGAKNPHRVIDKLARKKDLNSQLAVAHSKEIIYVSSEDLTEVDERSHQWLDENGWTHRRAVLMKRDGSVLSANLNIAHAKDGRNILYDINKITVIGHGAVPSNSKKSRGSHINTNNGKKTITQSSEKSNPSDGKKSKDDTIDADYLSAVEHGDMETAHMTI